MVYLDYAANTPIDKEVLDKYYEILLNNYGNPNSLHKMGRESKMLIDNATNTIADLLHVLPEEIIYTSGATESNNLVIKGICERYKNYGKHVLLSSLEHSSIFSPATVMQQLGFDVEIIPIEKNGLVNVEELKHMVRDDTILVSVTSVDSELGLVQPIEEIANFLKDYPNTYFHTDASQSIGKVDIDYSNVDLITIAPHKFYGINDIGILVKKKEVGLKPIINGGRSTTVFRSGTPNTASIVATSVALSKALNEREKRFNYVKELNYDIINFLEKHEEIHINNTDKSIPFTINFSVKGVTSRRIVDLLDEQDIYVSSKTSCCPVDAPSKLVFALTKDRSLSSSSIRLSISHLTTKEEIEEFKEIFEMCLKELENNGKI
jgi:cysteine desulfurase